MAGHDLGQITTGIPKNTLAIRTIEFVYRLIPAWRDDPERPIEHSETRLNSQLCKFLDSCARREFPLMRFDQDEYQSSNRRVDLSASPTESTFIGAKLYTIYDPIVVLECKRLPAPSSDRKMEYVTGGEKNISGGIQRFKLGMHGANLNLMAMIGYVQKESPRYWQVEVNNWITELSTGTKVDGCSWNDSEILKLCEEDEANGIAYYCSLHSRHVGKIGTKFELCHIWVVMKKK